jgi:molecular chaperone GrpE
MAKAKKKHTEMNQNQKENKEIELNEQESVNVDEMKTDQQVNSEDNSENRSSEQSEKTENQTEIVAKYDVLNDKYIRLVAEYDNYRKRTLKERMELIKSAGEDILINFLPAMDNIDRAVKSTEMAKDIEAVKQGIKLIHKNLSDFLKDRGIIEIIALGEPFDTDMHEAITKIPAPEENMKGKVVDVIEKGYLLKDKVVRYAKVVVGE